MFTRDQLNRMPDLTERDSCRYTGRMEFRVSKDTAHPMDDSDPLDWHHDTRVAPGPPRRPRRQLDPICPREHR